MGAKPNPSYERRFPVPTIEAPEEWEVMEWVDDGDGCMATDGCWTEADGYCEHGHPSWMLFWGWI